MRYIILLSLLLFCCGIVTIKRDDSVEQAVQGIHELYPVSQEITMNKYDRQDTTNIYLYHNDGKIYFRWEPPLENNRSTITRIDIERVQFEIRDFYKIRFKWRKNNSSGRKIAKMFQPYNDEDAPYVIGAIICIPEHALMKLFNNNTKPIINVITKTGY